MLLDVSYVVDNVDPLYQGEKRVVFLAILAGSKNGDLEDTKQGIV